MKWTPVILSSVSDRGKVLVRVESGPSDENKKGVIRKFKRGHSCRTCAGLADLEQLSHVLRFNFVWGKKKETGGSHLNRLLPKFL